MSNIQIFFQFVGWGFLLYLSNRTIKRTELSRLKDQLIEQIEGLSNWIELELNTEDNKTTARTLERGYTGRVSRVDLLLQQINGLAKCKLLNEDLLFDFWNLDIDLVFSSKELNDLKFKQQDAIETIETSYHSRLFKENIFRRIFLHYKPEIFGALLPLALLYFLHGIVSILFS